MTDLDVFAFGCVVMIVVGAALFLAALRGD